MKKDQRDFLITLGVVALAFIVIFSGIFIYSGMSRPLTVIESGSMEHYDESKIGVIDTGDMIIMKNDKSSIRTYVDSYESGYSTFGNYGDVIIYYRLNSSQQVDTSRNPIIHRAILWLDYNGDGTWSAPSLKDYPVDLWSVTSGHESWNSMTGVLILKGFSDFNGGTYSASIDLDILAANYPHSGYITKGDNSESNSRFDQNTGISGVYGLIGTSQIKAVAGIEIPWLGCIKLFFENNTKNIQSNSIPCLILVFVNIIMFFFVIATILEYFDEKKRFFIEQEESSKPVRHAKRR